MKKLLFTLTLLITLSSFGQSKKDSLHQDEHVIFIKKNNHHIINKNTRLLVLENKDTLILVKRHIPKFVYPEFTTKEELRKFKYKYSYIAFNTFGRNFGKKNLAFKQWNIPIKVYVDKSFSKENQKILKKIIIKFSKLGIPNLSISLVKNKKNANYYITTTEEILETFDLKKLDQYTDEQLRNRYKNNAKYFLATDNYSKNYSCTLEVNTDTFDKKEMIAVKVKRLFFSSLGRFYFYTNILTKESLLSTKYVMIDDFSEFDMNVLKTHYNYIYPFKVDFNLFQQIEKK